MRTLSFAARFALIATTLFALYAYPYRPGGTAAVLFEEYLEAYARLAGGVLAFFDPSIVVRGATIMGEVSLLIVKSCDAMEAKLLFASAILAYPGQWRRRLLSLVCGLAGLVSLNVVRIGTLYAILKQRSSWFDVFHIEIWPLVMIAAVGALFWLATRFVERGGDTKLKDARGAANASVAIENDLDDRQTADRTSSSENRLRGNEPG